MGYNHELYRNTQITTEIGELMHILKRITIILLFLSTLVFTLFYVYNRMTTDNTIPVISSDVDEIEASIYADEAELYNGITAWDDKDGDISDKVFIQDISNFIRTGVCNVTYVVTDSDNHVAKLTRRITYTDYESPRFILNDALVFAHGTSFSMLDYIGATDSIDGDISNQIKLISSTVDTTTQGAYEATFSVSNSYGDVVSATLPVSVVSQNDLAISIQLSTYLVYLEKGDSIDPEDYIESVTDYYGEEMDKDDVTIESELDLNTPGVYVISYSIEDENEYKGMTKLNVIIQD